MIYPVFIGKNHDLPKFIQNSRCIQYFFQYVSSTHGENDENNHGMVNFSNDVQDAKLYMARTMVTLCGFVGEADSCIY